MAILNGGVLVEGPTCVPTRYGLLSVAEVEDRPDGHWLAGVEYDLATCEDLFVITPCPGTPLGVKDPEGGTVSTELADSFTMVAGYRCSVGGRPPAEAWDHAEDRLARGELRTLERTFWTGQDVAGNDIRQSLGNNPDAEDLTPTPGTPVHIVDGLAILEDWAGENYPCSPIIHGRRGLGVLLARYEQLEREGNRLLSKGTGSRVAVGGGYTSMGPDGTPADEGTGWLYVTGSIKVIRGPVFFTPDRDALGQSIDRTLNTQVVFAERSYAIVQDCIVGAVLVESVTA